MGGIRRNQAPPAVLPDGITAKKNALEQCFDAILAQHWPHYLEV